MDGVKISIEDAAAMQTAMETLRATGELGDASIESIEVVMLAALLSGHRDASDAVKTSIALLAAEAHLRHERNIAPTAPLPLEPKVKVHAGPKCPWKPASWFGVLTEKDED